MPTTLRMQSLGSTVVVVVFGGTCGTPLQVRQTLFGRGRAAALVDLVKFLGKFERFVMQIVKGGTELIFDVSTLTDMIDSRFLQECQELGLIQLLLLDGETLLGVKIESVDGGDSKEESERSSELHLEFVFCLENRKVQARLFFCESLCVGG